MSALTGAATAFFLYDVAESIDLARLRAERTGGAEAAPRAPATASAIEYDTPPVSLDAATLGLDVPDGFRARFKLFDYGVVSVALTRALPATWQQLVEAGPRWFDDGGVSAAAERLCRALVSRVEPAVVGGRADYLSEDYLVYTVTSVDGIASSEALLAAHGGDLAQLLRGEREPLSAQERDEVLRHRLSYLATDLVIPAWNGAFVYDHESGAQASLDILEFANSQLLEFRYYDRLLDGELAEIYRQLHQPGWFHGLFGRRYTRAARHVHALFIDVNEVTDKTENALKISGDVYAARLFALAGARLGLDQWKANVREKLKTLDDIYRFAVEQTAMARGEFLEITVVIILMIELVLFLAGIME